MTAAHFIFFVALDSLGFYVVAQPIASSGAARTDYHHVHRFETRRAALSLCSAVICKADAMTSERLSASPHWRANDIPERAELVARVLDDLEPAENAALARAAIRLAA